MADTGSSGVSGSGSSQNAADSAQQSQAAAETAAAQQAAADKAAAEAAAAAAVDKVQAAPVDLSISTATVSQLSTMQVDTVPSLSSFQTLGGVPNAATYADIAQSMPATPATPATPAITEFNAFSPTFSITPNEPAAVAKATLNDVSINLGLKHTGDITANVEARMGIDPGRIGFAADATVTNGFNSLSVSTALGPFGPNSTPSYTGNVKGTVDLGNLNSFDFNAGATFNNQGFQNADVNAKLSRSFTENVNGYVQGGVAVDNQGLSRITGEAGLNATQNGLSFGLTGRGSVDVRTGETSGYFGFKAGGKF
ncbi:hypothetical protein [Lysobacter sp. CA199]|uniref:hypothetical protein n=1 Tax=Lysobacter sp. CA199 TaxID=3455608 RepID=UPI003F8D5C92